MKAGTKHAKKGSGALIPQIAFSDHLFMIEALDGRQYISNAKETFKHIDGNFKYRGANRRGKATPEILLDIYQMVGIKALNRVFMDIPRKLDELVMSEHQIIRFCEKYPALILKPTVGVTLFLTKVKKEYSIVRMSSLSDGLYPFIDPFKTNNVWAWKCAFRIITPQKATIK